MLFKWFTEFNPLIIFSLLKSTFFAAVKMQNLDFISQQKIGDHCGFNISGAVSSTSDRISSVSTNFQRFHSINPIDFELRFDRPRSEKVDLRSKLVLAGTETGKVSVKVEGDNDDGESSNYSSKKH